MAESLNATYYVEYEFDGGVSGMTVAGDVRLWNDPPNSRFELSSAGVSFTLLDTPTGAFVCGITPECQSLTPGDAAKAYLQDYIDIANASAVVGSETRTILGERVDCFDIEATNTRIRFDRATICINSAGVPLELSGIREGIGEASLVARSFTGEVDPAVFESGWGSCHRLGADCCAALLV